MPYGEPELLFYKGDMFRTMEGHKHFAVLAVQQMQDNVLLNTPTEDGLRFGSATSFASFLRFWSVAASRNSS